MKAVTHALALGLYLWVPTEGSCNGFFYAPTSTVPHTIASAPDCGSVGGKRFSLTQGGRLHEGSAPSDKQTCRLIVDCCRDKFSGLINKAAELYTGSSPIQDSPKAESRTLTNHHPYRSPCIAQRKHMNKQEANQLLDEVKLGKPHPARLVDLALLTTGDLHGKLYDLDTYLNHRFAGGFSPTYPVAALQNQEGEQA